MCTTAVLKLSEPPIPYAQASFTPYNHYSLLAAVEDNWHLGCLANTCDSANVTPIEGLAD